MNRLDFYKKTLHKTLHIKVHLIWDSLYDQMVYFSLGSNLTEVIQPGRLGDGPFGVKFRQILQAWVSCGLNLMQFMLSLYLHSKKN